MKDFSLLLGDKKLDGTKEILLSKTLHLQDQKVCENYAPKFEENKNKQFGRFLTRT